MLIEQYSNPKSNSNRTNNGPFEKRDLAGFINSEQKRERENNLKKILKEYPEIYEAFKERDQYEQLCNEQVEILQARDQECSRLENECEVKSRQIEKLTVDLNLEIQKNQPYKDYINRLEPKYKELESAYIKLTDKYERAKQHNEEIKASRGFIATWKSELELTEQLRRKDTKIKMMKDEIEDLKKRLALAGRPPITQEKISEIIELKKAGYSHDKIALYAHVSKSTVSKYLAKYN